MVHFQKTWYSLEVLPWKHVLETRSEVYHINIGMNGNFHIAIEIQKKLRNPSSLIFDFCMAACQIDTAREQRTAEHSL